MEKMNNRVSLEKVSEKKKEGENKVERRNWNNCRDKVEYIYIDTKDIGLKGPSLAAGY